MRVISVNLNGIRAAAKKGFFSWMSRQRADIVCIQETKAQQHQLTDPVFAPRNFKAFFHDAERKGYSGTAIYTFPFTCLQAHRGIYVRTSNWMY